MTQTTSYSDGFRESISEQATCTAMYHRPDEIPAIINVGRKDIRYAVADPNRGLMAKLSEAFFNYLRDSCK